MKPLAASVWSFGENFSFSSLFLLATERFNFIQNISLNPFIFMKILNERIIELSGWLDLYRFNEPDKSASPFASEWTNMPLSSLEIARAEISHAIYLLKTF